MSEDKDYVRPSSKQDRFRPRTVFIDDDAGGQIGTWDYPLWLAPDATLSVDGEQWVVVSQELELPRAFRTNGEPIDPILRLHLSRMG